MKSQTIKRALKRLQSAKHRSTLHFPPPLRKGVKNIKAQENLYFQVYWKDLEHGKGAAIIVYAHGINALKFDCFGPGRGHYHLNIARYAQTRESRIFLPEQTPAEQIERAIYEIQTNLSYYLQRHRNRKVRCTKVNQTQLKHALAEARALLLDYAAHPPVTTG